MLIHSRCQPNNSTSGPGTLQLESTNGQLKQWGYGRRRLAWRWDRKIINWGSASGRLPSPWAAATSRVLALTNGITYSIVVLLESVFGHLWSRVGKGTWQTRLSSIVQNSRQHFGSLQRMTFAEGRIESTKPQPRRGTLSRLVYITSPRWFFALPKYVSLPIRIWKTLQVAGLRRKMCIAIPQPMSLSRHISLPLAMWIVTLLGGGWATTILRNSHATGLDMMSRDFW